MLKVHRAWKSAGVKCGKTCRNRCLNDGYGWESATAGKGRPYRLMIV
jgi:hypothetical protein